MVLRGRMILFRRVLLRCGIESVVGQDQVVVEQIDHVDDDASFGRPGRWDRCE